MQEGESAARGGLGHTGSLEAGQCRAAPVPRLMEAFIQGVRAHPCLWNSLHPDYREPQVRDDAWQRIVKQCNINAIPNVKSAKVEWKKLRANHRVALKRAKLGQNKLLPAQITTWKYAKAMQFLEPYMKYRITEDIEMDPLEMASKNFEFDVSTTETTSSDARDISITRRWTDCVQEKPDADALELFFNCMLRSTRDMPPWMQTQVKKKIFAIIIDSEEFLSSGQNNYYERSDLPLPQIKKIKTEVYSGDN